MDSMPYDQYAITDEQATVSIAKDLLTAYLTFTPPKGGRLLSIVDLVNILKNSKVLFGVDPNVLKTLAGNINKQYGAPIPVAFGVPPETGIDAQIEFKFSISRDRTPKILPNGDVDHKTLNYVQNIHKGDLLAKLTKETQGVPGKNIFGLEVKPKPGRSRILPKGKNTEISQDGLSLFATADGTVEILDGRITVVSLLEIKGDVGVATGHIVFAGDVKITGNIVSTYNVTADGSIFIGGCIEASVIRAGKDITISHGVKGLSAQGISNCVIYAGGNITSKFIENATVFANGVIRTDSILHSKVSCYDTVLVWGRTGNIVGGAVRALKEIICDVVGSPGSVASARTTIESGITESIISNYQELKQTIEQLEADIERYKITIAELENYPNPSSAQNKRLYASNKSLKEAEKLVEEKLNELSFMDTMFEKKDLGKITINKVMYPPVNMVIERSMETFDETIRNSYFRVVDDKICVMNNY